MDLVLPLLSATGQPLLPLSVPQHCWLDFLLLPTSLKTLASEPQASCPLCFLSSQKRKEGRKERADAFLSTSCAPGTALPQAGVTPAPPLAQCGPALGAAGLPLGGSTHDEYSHTCAHVHTHEHTAHTTLVCVHMRSHSISSCLCLRSESPLSDPQQTLSL